MITIVTEIAKYLIIFFYGFIHRKMLYGFKACACR